MPIVIVGKPALPPSNGNGESSKSKSAALEKRKTLEMKLNPLVDRIKSAVEAGNAGKDWLCVYNEVCSLSKEQKDLLGIDMNLFENQIFAEGLKGMEKNFLVAMLGEDSQYFLLLSRVEPEDADCVIRQCEDIKTKLGIVDSLFLGNGKMNGNHDRKSVLSDMIKEAEACAGGIGGLVLKVGEILKKIEEKGYEISGLKKSVIEYLSGLKEVVR